MENLTAAKSRQTNLFLATCILGSIGVLIGGIPSETAVAAASTKQPSAISVLLIPYQSIMNGNDYTTGQRITQLVRSELVQHPGITVTDSSLNFPDSSSVSPSPTITRLEERIQELENNLRILPAIQLRKRQIGAYREQPRSLHSTEPYLLAQHHLARALFWSGQDTKAQKILQLVAPMGPELNLPRQNFSAFYRHSFQKVVERAIKQSPATVQIRRATPHATIRLDGQLIPPAPVQLSGIIPGEHLFQLQLAETVIWAKFIPLKSGPNPEITLIVDQNILGEPIDQLIQSISTNTLSASAIQQAVAAGTKAHAEYVVVGGTAKSPHPARLNVHSFVIHVPNQKIARLAIRNFDVDMLSGQLDALRIVQDIHQSIENFVGSRRIIDRLDSRLPNSPPKLNYQDVRRFRPIPRETTPRSKVPVRRRPIRAPAKSSHEK
ncbi:MAG: hypothetical protein KTR25_14745 [Myxococcales bacterium]|nr:hypothetical protein [Myxococcales bacterium]